MGRHRNCSCCGEGDPPLTGGCEECVLEDLDDPTPDMSVTGFGDWWDPPTPPLADCSCNTLWAGGPYVLVNHGGIGHECCWDWTGGNVCTFPRFGYQSMWFEVDINDDDNTKCDYLLTAVMTNVGPPAHPCINAPVSTPRSTWTWGVTVAPGVPRGPWVLPFLSEAIIGGVFCPLVLTPGPLTVAAA